MKEQLDLLKNKLREINDLQSAAALLSWDQETHMPEKGAAARARQMGTLQRVALEKFVSPEVGDLLDAVKEQTDALPADSDDAALIRVAHKDYQRMRLVPPHRMAAFVEHAANSYPVWARARKADDFSIVKANLEKTLEFSKEIAGYFPRSEHIANPLIDYSDPGMKVEDIRKVFAELRKELVPLVAAISEKQQLDNHFMFRNYPEDQQKSFGLDVVRHFGFDDQRCRQDKTHHPFMTKFSLNDVRITTRYDEHNFSDGFFSTVHETGHALYEMGINQAYDGLPLARGTSSGVHESQSRLWENIVGRSRGFWLHFYPLAQRVFSEQLSGVSLDDFYAGINKVQPSLIRTEADEVTYNLHVMIRFDLEMALLEGTLSIADLPGAWRERYQSDLGVSSPTDANGVLQDVHWFAGLIGGAFQGYTLGNIMSCQFYEKALSSVPGIEGDIEKGEFGRLHDWLKENIYRYGAKYEPSELLTRVTGGGLDIQPLVRHLNSKFGALYQLS